MRRTLSRVGANDFRVGFWPLQLDIAFDLEEARGFSLRKGRDFHEDS